MPRQLTGDWVRQAGKFCLIIHPYEESENLFSCPVVGFLDPLAAAGFLGGLASYVIIVGHSMEPIMYTGDLAIVHRKPVYKPGDIVAFRVKGGNVIHRIVGESVERFITKGDNKESTDPWEVPSDQIVGKLWMQIPAN